MGMDKKAMLEALDELLGVIGPGKQLVADYYWAEVQGYDHVMVQGSDEWVINVRNDNFPGQLAVLPNKYPEVTAENFGNLVREVLQCTHMVDNGHLGVVAGDTHLEWTGSNDPQQRWRADWRPGGVEVLLEVFAPHAAGALSALLREKIELAKSLARLADNATPWPWRQEALFPPRPHVPFVDDLQPVIRIYKDDPEAPIALVTVPWRSSSDPFLLTAAPVLAKLLGELLGVMRRLTNGQLTTFGEWAALLQSLGQDEAVKKEADNE